MEGRRGMGLRVNNKGINSGIKKRKKSSSVIKGLINYLKSDSYLYAPLIGLSSTSYSSTLGVEARKPLAQNKGNLRERLLKYMISDEYLYAPIVDDKPQSAAKTVIPQKENDLLFEAVTKSMLSRKIVWETDNVARHPVTNKQEGHGSKGAPHGLNTRTVNPNTPTLKETKKQAVHRRSYRLSTG